MIHYAINLLNSFLLSNSMLCPLSTINKEVITVCKKNTEKLSQWGANNTNVQSHEITTANLTVVTNFSC